MSAGPKGHLLAHDLLLGGRLRYLFTIEAHQPGCLLVESPDHSSQDCRWIGSMAVRRTLTYFTGSCYLQVESLSLVKQL